MSHFVVVVIIVVVVVVVVDVDLTSPQVPFSQSCKIFLMMHDIGFFDNL